MYELTRPVPRAAHIRHICDACVSAWGALQPARADVSDALRETFLDSAPERMRVFFDVTVGRKLAVHIPLAPLPTIARSESWEWWQIFLHNQISLPVRILQSPNVLTWGEMLEFAAVNFERERPTALVRSLVQTYISDGATAAGGAYEFEHVAISFVEQVAGVTLDDVLVRVEWHEQRHPDVRITPRLTGFLRKLAGVRAPRRQY